MAQSLTALLEDALPQLRYLPTPKRVRALLDGRPVADSTRAVLVWEPQRIVPSYAVPRQDVAATLEDAEAAPPPPYRSVTFRAGGPALLDPSVPFAVHTADGRALTVRAGGAGVEDGAFALDDPPLDGYVVFDFAPFDWLEEDQPLVGHPRDPMHRIDVCPSSRRIRIEHQGTVLAESDEAMLLFEGTFPMPRYYLPRHAIRVPLVPGQRDTTCAYKGHATHWTAEAGQGRLRDIAWSYEQPEHDAERVRGYICFYAERLDVFVDGEPVERVHTPWSEPS
jgi:uncharacterized protein (DUF427 family)